MKAFRNHLPLLFSSIVCPFAYDFIHKICKKDCLYLEACSKLFTVFAKVHILGKLVCCDKCKQ